MEKVIFQDLGEKSYEEAWTYQQSLHDQLKDHKISKRRNPGDPRFKVYQPHYLLFCEHPPVYTLGKSGSLNNLLLSEDRLKAAGFEFFKINRGGDITYHGPGQVVGYPIFDLDRFFTDVHRYVRFLEEIIIRTLQDFGITATRVDGFTGVWIEGKENQPNRKICAIGVHLSRWVSMHGFALNVNTKLAHFNNIVPCGIADKDKIVTSMQQELSKEIPLTLVKDRLKYHFSNLFNFEYATVNDEFDQQQKYSNEEGYSHT